jgi:hypothetical protein
LGAGIVKLARLPDNNRSRPDNEDGFNVGAFWHVRGTLIWGFLHKGRHDSNPISPDFCAVREN